MKNNKTTFKGTCYIDGTTAMSNFILKEKPLLDLRARDEDLVHGGLGGTQELWASLRLALAS